ncbi:homeobox protein 2-like [Centruroides sculpturatus]|uniref:homeobox protein 2-like n=1 Tax=Centruroides sculpturatus TaxID=218467 RepID=UPI000C6D041E|nr:homeobox protein 2-like [Centruroides sculpturatus]
MNKWSKFTSTQIPISEVYPSNPSSKETEILQETNTDTLYPLDGISQSIVQHKNFNSAFKHRVRINRRATIDSIPYIPKHSSINNIETEESTKTEKSNLKEKYATCNTKKNGTSNNSLCNTLLQSVDCKFGSTDSDKWNRKNDRELIPIKTDNKSPAMKYIETHLHQNPTVLNSENGYSSDSSSSEVSLETQNVHNSKANHLPSLENGQNSSTSQFQLKGQNIHNCISKDLDFKNDVLMSTVRNEENNTQNKNTVGLLESETYPAPVKQNISNSNCTVDIQEKFIICPELDDKSNNAKFQVVSLPSPGANTRTFTRQIINDKKLQQNSTNLIPEEMSNDQNIKSQHSNSTTDISGQSDSSLDEVNEHNSLQQRNEVTNKSENSKVEITLKYQKIKPLEHTNYKRAKNIQLRTPRRFTTDQAILPKDWEKIANPERTSAFKPISGRSVSCIDVSETVNKSHNSNINHIKQMSNISSCETKFLKKEVTKIAGSVPHVQNEPIKDIYLNKPTLQSVNYANSLDRKFNLSRYPDNSKLYETVQKNQLVNSCRNKDLKSPGYVAKIAESFNVMSKQEPSHFPSVSQIYQPVSSYATITKPKPLRGDQIATFHKGVVNSHNNHCFNQMFNYSSYSSHLENSQTKSQILINERKVTQDGKKDYVDNKQMNKFLRTATSEEIQNMYTSYGNSGRGFESSQNNFQQNTTIKEEIVSGIKEVVSKKDYLQPPKDVMLKKETLERLSHKLKSIKLNKIEDKPNVNLVTPFFSPVARSRISAAVQTDNNDDISLCDDELCLNTSLTSQESDSKSYEVFYNKPCQNMSDESILYSSNSSLNSSTSSGSHYYYVETQIRPELTISLPLVTQTLTEESIDNCRNSHLPRMGVAAMLGKKRSVSYGSSDSGSGETSKRLEQSKEYVLKPKAFLGHTSLPIDV